MSAAPQDSDESLSEVNVIPLADLSLVLLIILMVLSPMIMQSMIKVQSSRASAIHPQTKPEPPLILNVNPTDEELNSVKITNDLDLAARLAAAIGNRTDKTVMLTVGATVPHGRFVQILDLTKQQGADKIALLRRRDSGSAGSAPAKK